MVSVHAAKDVYETAVAEGMAKGMAKGILQIARNMKEEGIPLPTIARLSGLGVEEIEKL
jgi:predicted transposase/invertase (TIGR01784 family)